MALRRVVVSGLGALTPIGNSAQEYWSGLRTAASAAAPTTYSAASTFTTQSGGALENFNVEDFIDRKEGRKMDKYSQYAMVTATEAMEDAGFDLSKLDLDRAGVIWGSGIGGLQTFQDEVTGFNQGDG